MPTPSPTSGAAAGLKIRLRDAFWLETALREVSARSTEQQAALRTHYLAGTRRADVADQLTDEQSAVASLLLYREAITHFAMAAALSRDPAFNPGSSHASTGFALLRDLESRGLVEKLPVEVTEAETILGATDSLAFDTLSVEEVLLKRAKVSAATRFLRELIEPRTVQELKVSRFTRTAVAAAVIVLALAWAGWRLLRPVNLALHKPVTTSGHHPDSVAPNDNTGAVNGEIESNYGVHSNIPLGWVMVDLQRVHKLSSVKVYNRADGYFEGGLPFTLELSEDGVHFELGQVRSALFSSTDPWVYEAHGKPARYVRIRSPNYVALTEIEVYGN